MDNIRGNRLRIWRARKRISVARLSELSGVSQPAIYKLEKGTRGGGAEVWARLADALDTTADYLLGLTDDPDIPNVPRYPVPAPELADIVARLNELPKGLRSVTLRACGRSGF